MRQCRGRRAARWGAVVVGLGGLVAAAGAGMGARAAAHAPAPYAAHTTARLHANRGGIRSSGAHGRYPPGTLVELHRRRVTVTILNFAFRPARLVVSAGTRITWINHDNIVHTVVSIKNIWSSDALDTGDHFARVFGKAGTFSYVCSIHPFMHGTIIVKK